MGTASGVGERQSSLRGPIAASPGGEPDLPSAIACPKLLRGCLLTLLDASPGLVTVANTSGGLLYMNSIGRSMLGIDASAQVIGRKVSELYAPGAYALIQDRAIPTALSVGVWCGETTLIDSRGRQIPVSQLLMATRITQDVDVTVLSSIAWDIREHKQIEKELRHQATHDDLTGLPNRNLLMDRLAHALDWAERHRHFVGVLFVDLDSFKGVNDSFGHETANVLLNEFGTRLRQRLRAQDTIARYGGDEFVIVVPELRARDDLARVKQEALDALAEPFFVGDERIQLTASIGAATYPHDGLSAEALLVAADAAMYERKRFVKRGASLGDAAMVLRRVAAYSET